MAEWKRSGKTPSEFFKHESSFFKLKQDGVVCGTLFGVSFVLQCIRRESLTHCDRQVSYREKDGMTVDYKRYDDGDLGQWSPQLNVMANKDVASGLESERGRPRRTGLRGRSGSSQAQSFSGAKRSTARSGASTRPRTARQAMPSVAATSLSYGRISIPTRPRPPLTFSRPTMPISRRLNLTALRLGPRPQVRPHFQQRRA